jgi:hypothetical protein
MKPILRMQMSGAPPAIQEVMMRAAALNGGELTIGALRALSPFEENAQRVIDQAVVRVGTNRLVVAADLLAMGLTYPLPNALSIMELQWEQESKTGGAQRTMSPAARGEYQIVARRPKRVPIYLTTDDFSVGIRVYLMGQRLGTPIDTSLVESATRRVNEAVEDSTLNGGITVDGYTTPGLLNAPNANTQSMTSNWNLAATTGAQIFADVEAGIGKLQADNKFGPYGLYTSTTAGNNLDNDFKANSDLTIRQRLLQIPTIASIKTADQLPTGTAILVQLSSDVVDMIDGQRPVTIPWTSADGFTLYWMVMAIMVPRVRDDYDGNSGVVIFS